MLPDEVTLPCEERLQRNSGQTIEDIFGLLRGSCSNCKTTVGEERLPKHNAERQLAFL